MEIYASGISQPIYKKGTNMCSLMPAFTENYFFFLAKLELDQKLK